MENGSESSQLSQKDFEQQMENGSGTAAPLALDRSLSLLCCLRDAATAACTYGDDDDDTTWVSVKKGLDEQRVNSAVYVLLGTEVSLTQEELGELARGLGKSMLPFFWALRDDRARAESDSDMLPEGFEERVKGRGTVHVGWVPQIKILSHESVGGFLTHCGWNSLIEGLGFGRVPIIFPVLNEQGLNTRLLPGEKLGVEIPRDETDGSFGSDSVADSVRLAMEDEKGDAVRARAKEAKGLFGSRHKNIQYVDELVRYLIFEKD